MKANLKPWQIFNINVGLLGINFSWGLQMANMSAIYESLGAKPEQIPILWLAAPLTGLLVQPIVGVLSDHTWGPLGRRRPYMLLGALLAAFALVLMPLSHSIAMAAALLWLLDATINIGMGPFRALVPDLLPKSQQQFGFMVQGIYIAIGTVLASLLPWALSALFPQYAPTFSSHIPWLVKLSFWIGSLMLILTTLWTVVHVEEYPPENPSSFHPQQFIKNLIQDMGRMPATMKDLTWVIICSWTGIFCMYMYLPIAITAHIFHAEIGTSGYVEGLAWSDLCFAAYGGFFLLASLMLPWAALRYSPKSIHAFCLSCGGLGLVSMLIIHSKWQVMGLMMGTGVAFASMLSIPYAMVAESIPPTRMGSYMGIFNLFIVIPEILVSLGFGWVMNHWLHDARYLAVAFGGVTMLMGAVLTFRVRLHERSQPQLRIQEELL